MIYHGLLTEGLAIMRTVHDRYNPLSRNPFNEIEYSDHYSRAMSAYSVFLAVTGYDYHGPKGQLGFAPRLSPENFRAAFTAAEGWGSFSQVISAGSMTVEIQLAFGQLTLNSLALEVPGTPGNVRANVNGTFYPAQIAPQNLGQQIIIQFTQPVVIQAGQTFTVNISV
jgi:hypothetical protein